MFYRVRPSVSYLIIGTVLLFVSFFYVKGWLTAVQATVSIDVETTHYNLSIQADKRKLQKKIELSKKK